MIMDEIINENNEISELSMDELEDVSGGKSAGQKIKATTSVHVRLKPSASSPELGTISKGTTLTFLGQIKFDKSGAAWLKVSYKKLPGWICAKYAKIA